MGYTGAAVSALETLAQPVSDEMLVQLEQALGEETGIFEALRELVRLEKLPRSSGTTPRSNRRRWSSASTRTTWCTASSGRRSTRAR
ncbi:hypothetical protein ACFQ6B_19230 [Streptomyces wedmorensis]|uniref:Uncharacterized protein n=1 Tax=Streptomyces wedmorensis TaxID=43759 RepID=A0ABW6IUC0_STRWE